MDKWGDGSKFEVQWEENKISGLWVYSWLDGRQYKGDFKWIWQRRGTCNRIEIANNNNYYYLYIESISISILKFCFTIKL